ncbi:MAG: hypothetical protein A4E61_00469 [Syntrophorhabdus sp. PtaB.Bin184]|nr:MAG: hypothetical protein A4E61_00469 [Syntrophorhabdus sp. PtaB.Bin184]
MVLVEDRPRLLYVDVVLRRFAPGELDEPFQVGPHHRRFNGVGVHHVEAFELFLRLLLHLFGHLRLLDALPEFLDLLGAFIALAKLGADCPHLLPQEILPLGLRHLFLCLGEYLRLHVEELDLLAEDLGELPQTLDGVDDLQDLLGLVDVEPQVGGGYIGEPPRLVDGVENHEDIGRHHPAHGDHLLHLLLDIAHERLDLQGDLRYDGLFDGRQPDEKGRRLLDVFLDLRLLQTLDEDLHPSVGEPQHAHDLGYDAHGIDPLGQGIFVGKVLLGRHHD